MEETNAPLSELRVASIVRRYERVKLSLMVIVLCLNIAIGSYLIGVGKSNHESLVILKCAVAKTTTVDAHGKPRTPEAARVAFDACVKHG